MKLLFFTFYFPPDLSAGAFRSVALVRALAKIIDKETHIHIITTKPNRYKSFDVQTKSIEYGDKITIHRIAVPSHKGNMISQVRLFLTFAVKSLAITFSIKPDFIISTSGRLMTGVLTYITSKLLRIKYFIDIRDIFSEAIADVFLEKSRLLSVFLKYFFQKIERIIITNAHGINVVSAGFIDYFKQQEIDTTKWTIFMNGIDSDFINIKNNCDNKSSKAIKNVVYAGNIGYGQGLEKIIPACAKILENDFTFTIIGSGNTKVSLEKALIEYNVQNVELIKPITRSALIEYYKKADILFIHLNNYPAFKRVLPSKIFEYAALGKPIIAGLSGYSANFLKDEIPYSLVFEPGCIGDCIALFRQVNMININDADVNRFMSKFLRENIMDKMANHIMRIVSELEPKKINLISQQNARKTNENKI